MNELEPSETALRKLIEDLTMLVEASSMLAGSLKLENALPRTLDLCRSLVTADGYAVWLQSETGRWSLVSSAGLSEEYQRKRFLSLDSSSPMPDRPMIIPDAEHSDFPESHRQLQREEGIRSLLVVPLKIAGAISGTLAFYYKTPHQITPAEVRIGGGIGNLVGATMTSIRNCENEAALRRQAETARQRASFLAELSTVLSQSLELQPTLEKVVRLVVLNVAESCTIHLCDETGKFTVAASAHIDPELEQLQQALAHRYQPATNPLSKVAVAYETREAILIRDVDPPALIPGDPEATAVLVRLNPRSSMVVPLVARGKSLGVLSMFTTDPARKFNEDDLKFAQEIALHAAWMADNARLYSEVLEADARKDRFLAMLGHELRNPLAPVLTGVDILANPEATPQERAETVRIIQRQVGQMSRIVEDLLDVARIRSGRMEFKKRQVDLVRLVEDCASDHRQVFERMRIRFHLEIPKPRPDPLWAYADALRITQAIGNLLNNAYKFTPAGGDVHLSLHRISEHAATITISDSGMGIAPEMLPRLFETFSQADASIDRRKGGLGLGLALVKGLVDAHGGQIVAHSPAASGVGTEFILTLPLTAPGGLNGPLNGPAPVSHARRILIIEDNADLARTMSLLLTLSGHSVVVAHSGVEGLQQAAASGPQVVLCDIGLPGGMDGYHVARVLRQSQPGLKLVALTGYGSSADQQQSLDAGFNFHLTKPVDMKALNAIVCD